MLCRKSDIQKLKEYLYYSQIHDSIIESVKYNIKDEKLDIKAAIPMNGEKIHIAFSDVLFFLTACGNGYGANDTILSLTVEDDLSYPEECMQTCGVDFDDSVYVLFQMFSGKEIHVVSRNVSIETYE